MKPFCFLFIFSILTLLSCKRIASKNLVQSEELKYAIVNSITIPIHQGDTVCYGRWAGICASVGRKTLKRFYQPALDTIPYKTILESNYQGKFIFFGRDYPEQSENDTYVNNKIFMTITGIAVNNKKINIREVYSYNGKYYIIKKLYSFIKNQWTYVLIEEGWYDI